MKPDFLVVLNTCPDAASAENLAGALVEKGLAACVNIQPGLTSLYTWQGRAERSTECLLLIKTIAARYDEVEACIKEHHPYELPEIVAVPIVAGSADYLNWVRDLTCKR